MLIFSLLVTGPTKITCLIVNCEFQQFFFQLPIEKGKKKHFRNCFKNRKVENAHKMGPRGNKSLTLKT